MTGWKVKVGTTPDEVYHYLKSDRIWAGYAICDLENPLWEHSKFYLANTGSQFAVVLHFETEAFHGITAFGDSEGIDAIWSQVPIPPKLWISLRSKLEFEPLFRKYRVDDFHAMWRLHFSVSSASLSLPPHRVVCLGADRQPELQDFIKDSLGSAYSPEQLVGGVFYGVEENGKLWSVVGTHVLSTKYQLAAVGNAYTRPEYRGKGYFRACLSAVLHRLREMGVRDVVANVMQSNTPSMEGALSMGFVKHCAFWEGVGTKL